MMKLKIIKDKNGNIIPNPPKRELSDDPSIRDKGRKESVSNENLEKYIEEKMGDSPKDEIKEPERHPQTNGLLDAPSYVQTFRNKAKEFGISDEELDKYDAETEVGLEPKNDKEEGSKKDRGGKHPPPDNTHTRYIIGSATAVIIAFLIGFWWSKKAIPIVKHDIIHDTIIKEIHDTIVIHDIIHDTITKRIHEY